MHVNWGSGTVTEGGRRNPSGMRALPTCELQDNLQLVAVLNFNNLPFRNVCRPPLLLLLLFLLPFPLRFKRRPPINLQSRHAQRFSAKSLTAYGPRPSTLLRPEGPPAASLRL